jgi:hypothetical protein
MADIISWIATGATIVAAFMTASNLGSRITGYGFCIFLAGSISWLATGLMTHQPALVWTNVVLTLLNVFGIWRWRGRQAKIEEGASSAAQASERAPGESLFPISLLSSAPVEDAKGNVLGTCVDAMAGCSSGRLSYIVASEGGVAGVGETLRRVDWLQAKVDDDRLIVDLDERSFAALVQIERDRWPAR